MKNSILASLAIVAVGIISISNLNGAGVIQPSQLHTNLVAYQDQAPPAPEAAAQETQESVSDNPVVETPTPAPAPVPAPAPNAPIAQDSVLQGEVVLPPEQMPAAVIISDAGTACGACCCQPCCCPPCPVSTTFVLVDPCTCCSYEVCVTVPPCCVDNAPTVNWRGGIFGRRVANMCWSCCDKHVKVVVTRKGKVRVRG